MPNLRRCGAGSATTLGPPGSPVLTGANALRAVSINYVSWGGLIGGLPPLGAKMPLSQTVPETARWPEALSAPGSPSVLWKGGRWPGSGCRKVGKPWVVAFGSSGRQSVVAYPPVELVTFRRGWFPAPTPPFPSPWTAVKIHCNWA
jgi:hypothetical protein